MIDVYDEFIDTVMNKKVLTEYVKVRKKIQKVYSNILMENIYEKKL